jgi:Tfp pilus assembly protein PilX
MKRSLTHCRTESGFALLVVMLMMVVLGTMMAAYFTLSRTELQLAKASRIAPVGLTLQKQG